MQELKNAFIFPGQGSQYIGMASDLYNSSSKIKARYSLAEEILGYNIAEISFSGSLEKLSRTIYTQPAIFLHSTIMDDILKSNDIYPHAVAGHSLGEFSALVSANVLKFDDALKIIKIRCEYMEKVGKYQSGGMAALIGANEKQSKLIDRQIQGIVLANINAPGQIVISGDKESINEAIDLAKNIGIRKSIMLNVSGAFHSPLMSKARIPLRDIINSVPFYDTKIPVYQNVHAKPEFQANKIMKNLISQLESPVLWSQTITNMLNSGIKNFYEVGPGKVLSGLNRRIDDAIITQNFDKIEDLNEATAI